MGAVSVSDGVRGGMVSELVEALLQGGGKGRVLGLSGDRIRMGEVYGHACLNMVVVVCMYTVGEKVHECDGWTHALGSWMQSFACSRTAEASADA